MKKLGLVFCSAALIGLLSGCGGGSSSEGDGESSSNQLNVLVVKHGLTQKNKDIEWLNKLEEELELTIKWEEVSADWDQKKPQCWLLEIFPI